MLIFLPLIGRADIMLNAGESFQFDFIFADFNYQFDMPPPPDPEPYPMQFSYTVNKVSSPVNLRLSLFRDNMEAPFMVTTNNFFTLITIPPVTRDFVIFALDPDQTKYWPNGVGTMKLEALDASVNIESMAVATVIDDKYYTAAIPEPNSVVLLLIGSGVFYLRKKKRLPTTIKPF